MSLSFPPGTKMFQFPGFASLRLYIQRRMNSDYSETRFRIQKSPDRCSFASSPELFAGYHVFRRLSMPRHPPYTLKSLATFIDHRQLLEMSCQLPVVSCQEKQNKPSFLSASNSHLATQSSLDF